VRENLSQKDLLELYVENGRISDKATLGGDYKVNNKAVDKLIKIYKVIEKDLDLAKGILHPLLDSDVSGWAATHCLALGIYEKEAVAVLKSIKNNPSSGILGLSAEETLKEWRKGKLSIY